MRFLQTPNFQTTFSIDVNGILQLHVKDIDTGKEAQTTIETVRSKVKSLQFNKNPEQAVYRGTQ